MYNLPENEKGPQGLSFDRQLLERYMPAGMIVRKQWAVAGASKAPQSPNDKGELRNISVNEPNDWLTFDAAAAICEANRETVTHAAARDGTVFTQVGYNVGFIFHKEDEYACIDTDIKDAETHPHNPELWTTPEQRERHAAIVEAFDSYTEWSRSGKGLHILVKGKLPNDGEGKRRDGVEAYSQQRFLICTGNVFRDKPVEWRQELLTGLAQQLRANTQSDLPPLESQPEKASDEVVIERARLASNAEKFNPLWAGEWTGSYPSQSEADMALMGILAFYSPNNEQCIRLFRASGLGQREKAKRADYVNRTIKAARAKQAHEQAERAEVDITGLLANSAAPAPETQVPPHLAGPATEPQPPPSGIKMEFASMNDTVTTKVEYLLDPFLPRKCVVGFYGRGSTAKSSFLATLAALKSDCVGTLWVSTEENNDHIKTRHIKSGGREKSLQVVVAVLTRNLAGQTVATNFDVFKNLGPAITDAKANSPHLELGLVVLDTAVALTTWQKGESANDDGGVKRLLAFLGGLAERENVTIAIIGHSNKAKNIEFADSVAGSAAWTNSPRLSFIHAVDRRGDFQFVARVAKSNLDQPFAVTYQTMPVHTLHERADGPNSVLCKVDLGEIVWGNAKSMDLFNAATQTFDDVKPPRKPTLVDHIIQQMIVFLSETDAGLTRKEIETKMGRPICTRDWGKVDKKLGSEFWDTIEINTEDKNRHVYGLV